VAEEALRASLFEVALEQGDAPHARALLALEAAHVAERELLARRRRQQLVRRGIAVDRARGRALFAVNRSLV
jgi:hypothetical protein